MKKNLKLVLSQMNNVEKYEQYEQCTQQNRDSYFKKKNTCFKQKIA